MPSQQIAGAGFSPDVLTFLRLLAQHRVRYLVVGGEAVIYHGYPRGTGAVDFFYDNTPANSRRLYTALHDFWAGRIPGVKSAEELREPGIIIQFGRPPHRIDLMNQIDGVHFRDAWPSRISVKIEAESGPVPINYIDAKSLLINKQATARPKDLDDARFPSARTAERRRTKKKKR